MSERRLSSENISVRATLRPNATTLKAFLEEQLPEALELLQQMVGINSFTLNPNGVNRLAQFTAAAFAPLGFTAEFVPASNP